MEKDQHIQQTVEMTQNKQDTDDLQQKEVQNIQIITENQLYYVKLLKVIMSIQVIAIHHTFYIQNDYGLPQYCKYCERRWLQVLTPHFLVTYGTAPVAVFFSFAAIFQSSSVEKLQFQYRNNSTQFLKFLSLNYVKRYFKVRSILFTFGMGYGQLLYNMFGSHGRDVYYNCLFDFRYFFDIYWPFYKRRRIMYASSMISGSAWFSLSLCNVECLFYLYQILKHLFFKFIHTSNPIKHMQFDLMMIIIKLVIYLFIWIVFPNFDLFFDSNFYYIAGELFYIFRRLISITKLGKQITNYVVSKNNNLKLNIFSVFMVYSWLVMSRINYNIALIFILLPLLLDTFKFAHIPKTSIFAKFVDYYSLLQNCVYIIHHPLLKEAVPKYLPQLLPTLFSSINSIYSNYFYSWLLALFYAYLSIPLFYLTKPFEEIIGFVQNIRKYKQQKVQNQVIDDKFKLLLRKQIISTSFSIIVMFIVISVNYSGLLGFQQHGKPPAWGGRVPGYDPRWDES